MSRQQQAIKVLLAAVRENNAVLAAFLKGSFGSGTEDEFSDVDFYCLLKPEFVESFLLNRRVLLEGYRPILFWAEVNFVGPQVVAVFDDGLHVDLYAVTLEKLPTMGAAKVLYDPQDLLHDYEAVPLLITFTDVVHHFDGFMFTLVEIEAAIQRKHWNWAHHLVTRLPTEIAFVYRYVHDPDRARLALKNIDRVLDEPTTQRLMEAMYAPILNSTLLYIELMRDTARQYPEGQCTAFNWVFFDFMHQRILALR